MVADGPHSTENSNLALHVLYCVVQALANECLVVVLAAQDVPLELQLLHLAAHQLLAKLAFFLDRSQLLGQIFALLLKATLSLLVLTQLLRDSFLLTLDLLEFLFTASDNILTLIKPLLRLLLQLFLEFVILLKYLLLNLTFG